MTRDPETRVIDASELRGRLSDLMDEGPTRLYRRPPPAMAGRPPGEGARAVEASSPTPSGLHCETQLLTQLSRVRLLADAQASQPVDTSASGSVLVARPRPAPWRLVALGACAMVSIASLGFSQRPPAAALRVAAQPSATGLAVPTSAPRAAASPPASNAAPVPALRALDASAVQLSARQALLALIEGRRRDALVAYRRLGAVPAYVAVVRILERESQSESGRSEP